MQKQHCAAFHGGNDLPHLEGEVVVVAEAAAKSTKSSAGVVKVVESASCQTPDEWVATVLALTEPLKDEVLMSAPVPESKVWIRNPEKHASRGLFHLAGGPVSGVPIGSLTHSYRCEEAPASKCEGVPSGYSASICGNYVCINNNYTAQNKYHIRPQKCHNSSRKASPRVRI